MLLAGDFDVFTAVQEKVASMLVRRYSKLNSVMIHYSKLAE
jgi:hypothetical protein